jgi:hypothetical protein
MTYQDIIEYEMVNQPGSVIDELTQELACPRICELRDEIS